MIVTELDDGEIEALEAAGWIRCEAPHCIYTSPHWHDDDEETTFLCGLEGLSPP